MPCLWKNNFRGFGVPLGRNHRIAIGNNPLGELPHPSPIHSSRVQCAVGKTRAPVKHIENSQLCQCNCGVFEHFSRMSTSHGGGGCYTKQSKTHAVAFVIQHIIHVRYLQLQRIRRNWCTLRICLLVQVPTPYTKVVVCTKSPHSQNGWF